MSVIKIGFKRLTPDAVVPTKAHASDSGFDLVASADVIIEPGATVVVPTGIAVSLPEGYEAQVRPRSGVTSKTKLRVQLGTIDNGYSGEIGVIVDNIFPPVDDDSEPLYSEVLTLEGDFIQRYSLFAQGTYIIRKGDKLAQLVIQRLPDVVAYEIDTLGDSERGAQGFGSSGVSTYEDEYGNTQCRTCGGKVEGGYCNCTLKE